MIQYIKVVTNEKGEIVSLGFVDSMTSAYSAIKKILSETSGLPQDVSTKDHIAEIERKAREEGPSYSIVKRGLAKESGLAAFCAVDDHISKIKEKAKHEGQMEKLHNICAIAAQHSELTPSSSIGDHIAAIKLKAYNQGYDKGWHDKQADIQKRIKQFEDAIRETIENE